jgi:hypothetical protein
MRPRREEVAAQDSKVMARRHFVNLLLSSILTRSEALGIICPSSHLSVLSPMTPGSRRSTVCALLLTAAFAPWARGQQPLGPALVSPRPGIQVPGAEYGTAIAEGPPDSPAPDCPCQPQGPTPPPRERFLGPGEPLLRESWHYRPFNFGGFFGFLQGSPLVDDWVGMNQGYLGGFRLGWDHSYHWGIETRFSFGRCDLFDDSRLRELVPYFDDGRHANLFSWDTELLFYPWGDSRWRPYLLAGVGATRIDFTDRLSQHYNHTSFSLPVAVGLKYMSTECTALRFELGDEIVAGGGGLNTLNNLTFTAGIELRFGGARKSYWPWNPGLQGW